MQPIIDQQTQLVLANLGYATAQLAAVGETGPVYRCHDIANNKAVAVKILTQAPASLELPTDVAHPGNVPLLAVHSIGAQTILISPWIEGVSLAARLRSSGPLSVPEAMKLVRGVAELLATVHEHGRLHGSLKPADVLLGDDQSIRVLDTAWPRSAEPIHATARSENAQSDVCRLGSILYAALSGRCSPADSDTRHLVMDIAALVPNLRHDIAEICRGCLALDTTDRYVTVSEVIEELDRSDRGETIFRRQAGPLGSVATFFADTPALPLTLIAVVVLLLFIWPDRQIGWDKFAAAGGLIGLLMGAFIKPKIEAAPILSGGSVGFFLGEWAWIQLPQSTGANSESLNSSVLTALGIVNRWLINPWIWMPGVVILGALAGVGWTSLRHRDRRWRTRTRSWFVAALVAYLFVRLGLLALGEIALLQTIFAVARPITAFLAYAAVILPVGSLLALGLGAVSGNAGRTPGHIQLVMALGVLAAALIWSTFPLALTPITSGFFLFRTLSMRQLADPTSGWLSMPMGSENFATLILVTSAAVISMVMAIGLRAPRMGTSVAASGLTFSVAYFVLTRVDHDLLWTFRLLPMLALVLAAGAVVFRLAVQRTETRPQLTPTPNFSPGWVFVGVVFVSIALCALVLPPLRALSG